MAFRWSARSTANQRQDAVFEYLQEVQVKTSGLEAEYGGALGGVISAVTKSGGNTFRGSLYEHYSASWLRSNNGLAQRLQIDPVTQNSAAIVQDDDQEFNRNEFGGTIGGPIVRDHLFFFGSASPRLESLTRNYTLNTGEVVPVNRDRTTQSLFGKVTYSPLSRLQLNVSGLWTPDKADGSIVAYDGPTANRTTNDATFFAARQELGLRDSAVEHGVHRRLHGDGQDAHLDARRIHAGRLLRHRRQYVADVRVGDADLLTARKPFRHSSSAVSAVGRVQQPPANSDQRPRHHNAELRRFLSHPDGEWGRSAPIQGRLWLLTRDERCAACRIRTRAT